MELEPAAAAVLLIDLQRSFIGPDGSMARQGRDLSAMQAAAEGCARLARAARAAGRPVIWSRILWRPDYRDGGLLTREIRPRLAEIGALAAGSGDEEIAEPCRPEPEDLVFDKPRYSCFYASPLPAILSSLGVRALVVGGVTTSMCVETTVRDAGQRDIPTFVAREACGDFDAARHDASLDAMAFGFADVVGIDAAEGAFLDLARRGGP